MQARLLLPMGSPSSTGKERDTHGKQSQQAEASSMSLKSFLSIRGRAKMPLPCTHGAFAG